MLDLVLKKVLILFEQKYDTLNFSIKKKRGF